MSDFEENKNLTTQENLMSGQNFRMVEYDPITVNSMFVCFNLGSGLKFCPTSLVLALPK